MKNVRIRLSTLWVFVMFNMVFADILSFMLPDFLNEIVTGTGAMTVTQGMLLVFALLLEIPIAMIVLSRVLKRGVNRWVNIVAAVITIIFVIGGGSTTLHYIFFATMEVVAMLLIIGFAWKWPESETQVDQVALALAEGGGSS